MLTVAKSKAPEKSGPPNPRIDVRDLLQGSRQAVLVNAGVEYRLSLTSEGKLLLTK